jgi:hypothetical protein
MKKPNFNKIARDIRVSLDKHSPQILMGVGIAGMITTTVLAVKATPKALQLIEEKKRELETDELSVVDTVKTTWKCYAPAVVTGTLSTICLIGSNSVSTRRTAAIATAYKISETALEEYRAKVVETIGEKKEQIIKDKVAEEQLKKNPISKNEVIITEKGNTLCYDAWSGRYFKSDIEKIKKVQNDMNYRLINDMYVSLNEFYSALGLNTVDMGYELGWNLDRDGKLELDYSAICKLVRKKVYHDKPKDIIKKILLH